MPLDMLREMWLGLKRLWGLKWTVKGPILVGSLGLVVLIMAVVAAVAFFPGDRSGIADRRNEELMASLPLYPGAVLIEKHAFDDYRRGGGFNRLLIFRTMTYAYATPEGSGGVADFFERKLRETGWEPDPDQFGGTYTFRKDDTYFYLTMRGPDPSRMTDVETTVVAAAPRESTFFTVSVAHLVAP